MPVRTAVIAAILAGGGAAAAQAPSRSGALIDKVVACRTVADGAARLACFDGSVQALGDARARQDFAIVDRKQAHDEARHRFGLGIVAASRKPDVTRIEPEVKEVTAEIRSARVDDQGHWTVVLADGAVWQQVDDAPVARAPRKGSTARIHRGALGSFFLQIDGKSSFKARRIS